MIRCRRENTAQHLAQPGSAFVNSRFGMTLYGSNCLDRRCSLCDRARAVGTVFGKAGATKACPIAAGSEQVSPVPTTAGSASAPPAVAAPAIPAKPAEATPGFTEKIETM